MLDSVTVDTPDLLDAVRKATSVAAKRGAAFDKAAGIRFEHQGLTLLVKATDLDTSVRCELPLAAQVGIELEPFRLPAPVLAAYLEGLPLGDDSQVVITPRPDGKINFSCGDCQATLNTLIGSYPQINAFEVVEMGEAEGLSSRLRQVGWACSKDSPPLDGVHITGTHLVGCDKFSLAMVECAVPVERPLTAPLAGITAALRGHSGPMRLALQGQKLLLVPDPSIQFTANTYAEEYPTVQKLVDRTSEYTETTINRDLLLAALDRILALFGNERYPAVELFITEDGIHMEARVDELGLIQDRTPIAGFDGQELTISFNPSKLSTAINHAQGVEIIIAWPPSAQNNFVRIEDRHGYTAVIAPLIVPGQK